MNKTLKTLLVLTASAAALYFGKSFVDERLDYGTSFMRPGRWY